MKLLFIFTLLIDAICSITIPDHFDREVTDITKLRAFYDVKVSGSEHELNLEEALTATNGKLFTLYKGYSLEYSDSTTEMHHGKYKVTTYHHEDVPLAFIKRTPGREYYCKLPSHFEASDGDMRIIGQNGVKCNPFEVYYGQKCYRVYRFVKQTKTASDRTPVKGLKLAEVDSDLCRQQIDDWAQTTLTNNSHSAVSIDDNEGGKIFFVRTDSAEQNTLDQIYTFKRKISGFEFSQRNESSQTPLFNEDLTQRVSPDKSNRKMIIGLSVGGAIIVLLLVLVIIACMFMKRKQDTVKEIA